MADSHRELLDAKTLHEKLNGIAAAIASSDTFSNDELAIIGIRTRGAVMAQRLQTQLAKTVGKPVLLGLLDITLYRDDLDIAPAAPTLRSTEIDFDLTGKKVILVDDVLYTGRTVRAALNALADFGRPLYIKLAVLIDRGGRELPIEAQFVGHTVKLAPGEMARVHLKETDGKDEAKVIPPKRKN